MTRKIERKIVGYNVIKPEDEEAGAQGLPVAQANVRHEDNIVRMHENVARPESLTGNTYKIKTPVTEHAFYITINDIVLNPGTPYEKRRPFEIFVNSKNMEHYQWITALTLIISAVFRKGGDVTFMVDELQGVFDPKGGYIKPGTHGQYVPSLVAEIGNVVEAHLKKIGMIVEEEMSQSRQAMIEEKRKQFEEMQQMNIKGTFPSGSRGDFPIGATLCEKCYVMAVVMMDGCMVCLNCGESKCG